MDYFAEVSEALSKLDQDQIKKAVDILRIAKDVDSFVWILGNGGSAATASHFANDLLKMAGIRAIAIPDMTPTVTAYGNDNGWENMFGTMLSGLASEPLMYSSRSHAAETP